MSDFIGQVTYDLGDGKTLIVREYKAGVDFRVNDPAQAGAPSLGFTVPLTDARDLGYWLSGEPI